MKDKYIERECPVHGLTKFIYVSSSEKYLCAKCRSNAVQRKRHKIKHDLIEYKGGKCEICGYDKCEAALEFHHINPEEKDFGIAYKGYTKSLEKCKKEVDKCMLLCANCHREIHDKERDDIFLTTKDIGFYNTCIKKIDKIDKDLVLSLINCGKNQKEIAKEINVSLCTLKRFLHDNGIRKLENKVRTIETHDVISLIKQGKTLKEIANELNVSYGVIKSFMRKNDISVKKIKNIPR